MAHPEMTQPDFGTGQKKLGIYTVGVVCSAALTLISFWTVMYGQLPKLQIFAIIYAAACIQFLVQLVCFLRLNIQTEQGRVNVMSILFTAVILISIVVGSLWIMSNLNYYMAH